VKGLLKLMLAYDPKKRITAEVALKHAWFQNRPEDAQTDADLRVALKHLRDFNAQLVLQKAVLTYFATHQLKQPEETRLRELFDSFDVDKDGRLNLNDLILGYQRLYKDVGKAKAEAEQILRKADLNHNGIIDYTGRRMSQG
jgi:calcium-dependent protein kinase